MILQFPCGKAQKHEQDFGQSIKSVRRGKDITLRDLARATGLDHGYITSLEKGKTSPSRDTVAILAEALSIPESELLVKAGYVPEPKPYEALDEAFAARLSYFALTRARDLDPDDRGDLVHRLMAGVCLQIEAIAQLHMHPLFSRYSLTDLPHGRFLAVTREDIPRIFNGEWAGDESLGGLSWRSASMDDYLALVDKLMPLVRPLVSLTDALQTCMEHDIEAEETLDG